MPAVTSGSDGTGSRVLTHSSTNSTSGPTRTHGVHERSGASGPSATSVSSTRQQPAGTRSKSSTISASSGRQHEGAAYKLSSTAIIGDNLHSNSTTVCDDELYKNSTEVGIDIGDVPELVDGEVDLDDFEDFDDDLYDEMEMEMEGEGGEGIDIPGHHEWPMDNDSDSDFQLQEQDAVNKNYSSTMKKQTHSSETRGEISAAHSHSRMESDAPKSKLSLRQQKSGKTRVCELEHGDRGEKRESQRSKNPPVASVKPIQQQQQPQELPQNKEKQDDIIVAAPSSGMLTESELYEEPIVLKSIPEVENNSWKLQPFVKIKVSRLTTLYLP